MQMVNNTFHVCINASRQLSEQIQIGKWKFIYLQGEALKYFINGV